VAPSGGLILCEDGGGDGAGGLSRGEQLVGLTPDGDLFPFAETKIVIPNGRPIGGRTGDQRRLEWAGATFTADGKWLFANTGPWNRGSFGAAETRRNG